MVVARDGERTIDDRPELQPPPLAVGGRQLRGEELYSWWRDLAKFAARFRSDYSFLWPEWPACWFLHRGLVELLALLYSAQEALVKNGPSRTAPRDGLDWTIYVQSVAHVVYRVHRTCRGSHLDHDRVYRSADAESDAALEEWLRGRRTARMLAVQRWHDR